MHGPPAFFLRRYPRSNEIIGTKNAKTSKVGNLFPQTDTIALGFLGFSCGTWNENKGSAVARELDYGWAEGVISAYNEFVWRGKNVLADSDAAGMMGWLDNYCIAHPEDALSDAMDAFITEMKAKPHAAAQ